MKVLALSDKQVQFIYSTKLAETFSDVDLILGCGDLPARYLEYVLTVLNVPCVYVHGNHDPDNQRVPGAVSAEGRIVEINGLSIFGLGGSPRYKAEGRHQYTESQMKRRIWPHLPKFWWRSFKDQRAFDILLTHAPARGIHDDTDPAHLGFEVFLDLMALASPRLMVHGHTHVIPNLVDTETKYRQTFIVNAYPYKLIELPAKGAPSV